MAKAYSEELVYIESEDGVRQVGAVIRPAHGATRPLPIVWIHGFTGQFHEQHAILIGRELASRGYTFVTGNNRGHDFGAVLHAPGQPPRLGGAAWENLEESPRDVAAWISYAVSLGYPEVALLGHSLGGMKVTYYQSLRQDPRVRGLIIASGPVWRFVGPAREAVEEAKQSQRMVAEGRGLDLLPWQGPGASTVSAQRVVSAIGFNQELFGTPSISQIKCPIFAFLGTEEAWLGTPPDLDTLRKAATATSRVDTRVFEGADHCYVGHEAEVAAAIADWVATLS